MAIARDKANDETELLDRRNPCQSASNRNNKPLTRHELIKNTLFKEILEEKLKPKPSVLSDMKYSLKKVELPIDMNELSRLHQEFPLYNSSVSSFWEVHAHPMRKFHNTYAFTKPNSKCYDEQWR